MNATAVGLFVVVALAVGRPALAQLPGLDRNVHHALGGLRSARWNGDLILCGLPSDYRRLHGYRVHESGSTMVVLDDDGATSWVDMSAISTQGGIELGKAVTLAVRPGREPSTFIAGRIHIDPVDPLTGKIARRPFDSVLGTVEAIQGGTITFRTYEGRLLHADASRMPGRARIHVNDRGALTYERGPKRHVTALWLEPRESQPAAGRPRFAGGR